MKHERLTKEAMLHMSHHEIQERYNALYAEWLSSEGDAVRIGRSNDRLCDEVFELKNKVAELEARLAEK